MIIRSLERKLGSNFDWPLTIGMLAICGVGLCVLYSAGFDAESQTSVPMRKQAASMAIGLCVFLAAAIINPNFWRRWAWAFFCLGCGMLMVLDAFGIVAGGARRWLDLGGFRMQPSEFMKVGIILVCARILSSEGAPADGYTLKRLCFPAIVLLLPFGLTLVQPDLGTALTQGLVGASMLYLAGIRPRTFFTIAASGVAALIPAWSMLHDYQKKRVLNFLSPEMDPLGSGYHAIQSKIAVGSGAIAGKGFLQGTQTQLRFLPEQTTDFFFSVLAEEWGFLGSAFTVLLYLFLIQRVFRIAMRAEDKFHAYVCFGVAALFFWHVVINIGMVTGVVPVVGITLPLLSYGGSSVVTMMLALGLVARVSSKRFLFA